MGGWSTGIFGCFSDPGTCCLAIFGAPLLIGENFTYEKSLRMTFLR